VGTGAVSAYGECSAVKQRRGGTKTGTTTMKRRTSGMRWMAVARAARHPLHKSRRTGSFRAHSRWNNVLSARLLCARARAGLTCARAVLCMDACTRVLPVCMDRCVSIAYLSPFSLSLSLAFSRGLRDKTNDRFIPSPSPMPKRSQTRDSRFSREQRAIAEAIESVKL